MEKYLLIIKIILLSYNLCVAQENQISEPSNLSGNDHRLCIFAEIGGTGGNTLSGNIEYQLLFKNNTRGAYFRGGLGIFEWNPFDGGYFNYRPLAEAGFLIGKNSKYFDIGLGFSLWDYDSDKYWDSDSDK